MLISLPRSYCSCRAACFPFESYFALASYRRKYRGVITRDISHFAILDANLRDAPGVGGRGEEARDIRERDRNLQKISAGIDVHKKLMLRNLCAASPRENIFLRETAGCCRVDKRPPPLFLGSSMLLSFNCTRHSAVRLETRLKSRFI